MLRLLYFARLRESLGLSSEQIDLPAGVVSVADLMAWLAARGGVWQREFAGNRLLRAAVNQDLVTETSAIGPGDEIAFFPPVTGG